MLTKEEHTTLLRSFEVDRLLKLLTLEAKRRHDGHLTIFALTTHYQVAFGPPALASGKLRPQLAAMHSAPTLKEALIAALVEEKAVEASCAGAPDRVIASNFTSGIKSMDCCTWSIPDLFSNRLINFTL